jgi:cleavage and polyadenylation specificity factor subunit 6/7
MGFWGAQPQWNFRGCQLPWQHPAPTMQAQQQHGVGGYGKVRGMRQGRPERSDEKGIGNVRSHPERMQSDHDGGDLYKEHDREERSQHGERAPDKEREPERQWDGGDGCRGNKRRYQECTDDDDDDDRRVWARARSQSRNDGYADHPRKSL